jgi:hypothetical protein
MRGNALILGPLGLQGQTSDRQSSDGGTHTMTSMSDVRRVRIVAATCVIVLAICGLVRIVGLPSIAPRVNIRWADRVSDLERATLEQQFRLREGEHREGSTWAYDLRDPSWSMVRALIAHPAVADTHYINRRFGLVTADAPAGTTRLPPGGLSGWRDSSIVAWAGRLALSILLVSLTWLATTGRTARREMNRQTRLST